MPKHKQCSLDDAQRHTRAFSFAIVTTSGFISLQSAIVRRFSIVPLHQVPVLVRLTFRRVPWASLPLLGRVAAPPARSSARRRAACPHVGLSPQPTLEAPREGLRQGDVGGGGWTEAEPPVLRNQMLRGFPRYPARTFFGSIGTDTETPKETRIQTTMINYNVHHNRIYNNIQ